MAKIQVLSQEVADKIAAGEVAERPSAVVKELVENSIDAGATSIEAEIKKGGIEYIRIGDNGCGIEPEQAETAFLRHATSKLKTIDDLYKIETMGFRGEALSSICAVAEVELVSKTADNDEGIFLHMEHGSVIEKEPMACGNGTNIIVKDLFKNIPARMKFLKKDSTEAGYVADVLTRIALANPNISFIYTCDEKEVFVTSGDGNLKNAILNIYGIDHAKASIPVDYTEDGIRVSGVVGKPEIARGNRTRQTLLVNGRYIKNHVVSKVVSEAYKNSIMIGKFPFFVLNIELPPELLDVNVHPAKTEVKFANENKVYEIVYRGVVNALAERQSQPTKIADVPKEKDTDGVFKKHDAGGYKKIEKREEKVDTELVKEYMSSIIPKENNEVKKEESINRGIFSDFNFLEEKEPITIREKDLPVEEEKTEKVEPIIEQKRDIPTPIGQLFDTYILCQSGDMFYMIDQHAAHERMRFELLKKSYYENERMSQLLLTPVILKLDYSETQTVLENLDIFSAFGFEIEDFGSGSIIVQATPIIADDNAIRDLILEIQGAIAEKGKHSIADFEEKALDMIACKYAIKANHKLNTAEMTELIKNVSELEEKGIRTCPHGRPIKIEYSKYDIEKMFKRIV